MHFEAIWHTTNTTLSGSVCDSSVSSAWPVICCCSDSREDRPNFDPTVQKGHEEIPTVE